MCNTKAEYSYTKCLQIYKICFSTITDERYTDIDQDKICFVGRDTAYLISMNHPPPYGI